MNIRATSAVLFVPVLVSTTIQAGNWRRDGVDVPDTSWSKSDGDLGARLILTDKPDEFFANWEKEADSPAVPAKSGKPSCKLEENCDCSVPGITIRWKAAYCMLHEETDDLENAAVQECLARPDPDEVRKLPACEQNMHWKTLICRAHDAQEVRDCVDDESFVPRVVEAGPGG